MSQRITLTGNHGLINGDLLEIKTIEDRWWVKLWYKLTFRIVPKRVKIFKITANTSMTLTIKEVRDKKGKLAGRFTKVTEL